MKNKKTIIFGVLILTIATTVYGITVDILEQLNLQKQRADIYVLNNFAGDWTSNGNFGQNPGVSTDWQSIDFQLKQFQIPSVRTLASITKGDKVGAAKELCTYVKAYVESPAFIEAYKAKRGKSKPTSEPYRPDEATIRNQKADLKRLETQQAQMKKMLPPAQYAQFEKGINDMRKQIAEWSDPAPNKTRWLKMYPEDASVMVKQRLEEYLTTAATVDFNATLIASGRKQKFTNPAYENQSLKWKAIYRAGKDVNDEVTKFVKNWLQEGVTVAK